MKPITLRLWVPDETPDAILQGSRVSIPILRDWLLTLDQESRDAQLVTDEELSKIADGIAARDYDATVADIVEDLKRATRDGEITDRDGAIEWLEQTIDGHHDVIYTYAAMEVCRQSKNDGAYFDDFGSEGAVTDGGIEWSKLAYCALRADVLEAIGDVDEWFQCSECNGEVTPADIVAAGDDLPVCADCRDEGGAE